MSEFGSIRVIILVYTGRTDPKQIVSSQNNKMILFYFHGSVKHFNIVNACSVVDLIILKAEPDCQSSLSNYVMTWSITFFKADISIKGNRRSLHASYLATSMYVIYHGKVVHCFVG